QAGGFVPLWSLPLRVWAGHRGGPGGASGAAPPAAALRSFREPPRGGRSLQSAASGASPDPRPEASAGSPDRTPPVWHTRFASQPAADANAFTRDRTDRRLIVQDLQATRAHVGALHRAEVLDSTGRD